MSYCPAFASAIMRFSRHVRDTISRLLVLWGGRTSSGNTYFTDVSASEVALHVELVPNAAWRKISRRWRKSLLLDPKSARILNNLGVAYEQRGLLELAGTAYRQALELAPDNACIRRNYELFRRATDKTDR